MVRVLICLLPCFLGDCRELLLANDDKEYSKDRNELIYLIVCHHRKGDRAMPNHLDEI